MRAEECVPPKPEAPSLCLQLDWDQSAGGDPPEVGESDVPSLRCSIVDEPPDDAVHTIGANEHVCHLGRSVGVDRLDLVAGPGRAGQATAVIDGDTPALGLFDETRRQS